MIRVKATTVLLLLYFVLLSFSSVVLVALLSLSVHSVLVGNSIIRRRITRAFRARAQRSKYSFFSYVFWNSMEAGESIIITRRTSFIFDFN